MTPLEAITEILFTNLPYTTYVATDRHRRIAEEILAALPMVDMEHHNAAIKREIDWQHHWGDKCERAELEAGRLRRQLDATSLERVTAVRGLANMLPTSRTAKHDGECWQRHPGCLARRVSDLLDGREVTP